MDAVEEIKTRLDIVDAIQEYIPLKPAGTGSFKGLCPFHQEKTPSFFANRPRQSWHCFGCDQGGDVISFVMRMEGLDFRDALELLAQKTGVILPSYDSKKSGDKKRLFEVNDLAARWFRNVLLRDPRAEEARRYVAKRGIDNLNGDIWRVGYAPDSWSSLGDALSSKDVTQDELTRAGLAIKRDTNSVYDRFRDRVMFTICDLHGNVVGFTGRTLSENAKEAKYVNTPETEIYKKSAVLFGLDKAKGEIKRQDKAVLVEGNMDAITAHINHFTNVIATSGTALTHEQLSLLKRFTKNIAIAFDQDNAGKAATLRGLDLARAQDFNLSVINLPPDAGKDPDEVIRKDKARWETAVKQAVGLMEWLYRNSFSGRDINKPEDKKLIARDFLTEIKRISDPVERDAWLIRLAEDLKVSPDALRESLKKTGLAPQTTNPQPNAAPINTEIPRQYHTAKTTDEKIIQRILAIVYLKPELKPLAEITFAKYNFALDISSELSNFLAIFADSEFEDQSLPVLEKELALTLRRLDEENQQRKRKILEQEMRQAERTGDQARIKDLLAQFNNL
ncbi:DNA primase [Patescibacteria group bacterium]|nr:DNA primase [Patescibacteria group bacterium]MBU1034593.1 DNA primase [Patescibacteria group bacterium]MBU1630099.1 DNA primase [Patescibacteria group bacterium]MBU1907604.1 DNA primase [Patescibacteria group bacterium]